MITNYPLKLWIYTFCYNEEEILPYVIAYWKQYATKVIVYDNGSTDNSLKILSQYSWIEVREFDTENTFDPEKISQYKSFCYADAIGKADYVMVCDIDEVLLPTENLFPELVLAKKDNVQLFQTKYYEIINNELDSKYDSLIHTAEGYYAYPNPNIHKAIVFDPQIKIAFGYNSLTYSTNRNYITKSIITLHLKMISSNILVSRQKNLYLRLNKKYQDDVLYYGNIKNIGTRLSYFKLLFPHKYRFNKNENYITVFDDIYTIIKNSIKFKDLTWLPTKINHNFKSSNKECIFGIPIYKSDLTTTEKASLTQLCKIIQNKFEICLICPEDLNLREYIDIADKYDVKLSTLFCAKQYFIGTASYSYMCETADFYKCFSEYKYLFIYQLDGWIFEDNVQKYLDLDVDYIGSPWNVGSFNLQCDTIGNGGVCLRKVQKFIDVCNSFTPEDYEKDWVKTEDLFFCKTMRTKANFKLPTVQIGSNFSLCGLWGRFMTKYNDGKLPMCLHGWYRDYSTYWKKYINLDDFEITGDIKIVQQPTQTAQKYDYKTRLELIKMRLNNSIKPINIQPNAKIENTKIENKKEITQKTTMSSGYSSFLASYYGIKPKNNEIKQNVYSNTQTDKQAVSANKVEENKVEEKNLEVKQETINSNQHINILIIHYNTPYLTECLIKSINKFVGHNCTIYIFDNSDKVPFTYRQSNIKIFDNTKGQIINFEKWLEQFPNKGGEAKEANGRYISARHCISVDKCFDLINDNFILLDSDVLIKKDIRIFYNEKYIFSGNIESNGFKIPRLLPYICFINVKECKNKNIRYFNKTLMHGICYKTEGNKYDTGASFYKFASKYPYNLLNISDYIEHYKGASWDPNYVNNIKYHKNLTTEEWLNNNKQYWLSNNKVIYTCVTGNYEKIIDPTYIQQDFDYICFTDNPNQTSKVWKFREIPEELQQYSKVKQQRLIKISPHKYLSEYSESLWIDGSIDILSDMNKFINTYCNIKDKCVYIRRHPNRKCIYSEATICISMKKDTSININPQIKKYKDEKFPSNFGLVETNIIYRKHNEPYCIKLMNLWASELINGSHRDQLSFNYALWRIGDNGFQYLDTKLLNCNYFKWYSRHNRN